MKLSRTEFSFFFFSSSINYRHFNLWHCSYANEIAAIEPIVPTVYIIESMITNSWKSIAWYGCIRTITFRSRMIRSPIKKKKKTSDSFVPLEFSMFRMCSYCVYKYMNNFPSSRPNRVSDGTTENEDEYALDKWISAWGNICLIIHAYDDRELASLATTTKR